MKKPEVQKVFDKYANLLQHTFKYFGMQDSANTKNGFNNEKIGSYITQKEFQMLAVQRNITPSLITPDDTIFIYKQMIKEKD